jgi:hypothetical protein
MATKRLAKATADFCARLSLKKSVPSSDDTHTLKLLLQVKFEFLLTTTWEGTSKWIWDETNVWMHPDFKLSWERQTCMHDNNITQLDLPALHEYYYASKRWRRKWWRLKSRAHACEVTACASALARRPGTFQAALLSTSLSTKKKAGLAWINYGFLESLFFASSLIYS